MLIILGVILLHGVLLVLLLHSFRSRFHASTKGLQLTRSREQLLSDRTLLEKQVATFNTQAKVVGLEPLLGGSSGGPEKNSLYCMGGGICDYGWPTPKMVHEVEADNPELVSLVRRRR